MPGQSVPFVLSEFSMDTRGCSTDNNPDEKVQLSWPPVTRCACCSQAGTVRDSMAKSLYSALFDWIVFRINHALLNNKDLEESAKVSS